MPSANVSLKRYRYLGKERDEETWMYHLGARYYAAWLGRFTSADPAGFAGGINLYAYGANNPFTFTDPYRTGPRKAKEGDVNPLNDVSWEVPKWVKSKEDFQKWLPPDNRIALRPRHADRADGQARGKTVPVFGPTFLDPARKNRFCRR